jgi:hypothetical protein
MPAEAEVAIAKTCLLDQAVLAAEAEVVMV